MVANLNNAKDYSNGKAKQKPQQPKQQITQSTEQQESQPLALPSQSMVLFQQLKTATQADMAAIDRMFEKRREVVSTHYDKRSAEFAEHMAKTLGVEVDEDFFSQSMTLDAALAEFDSLLTEQPDETEETEPEVTEETPIDATAVAVEVMPVELAA